MPVISTNLAANSAVRYLNINSASQTSSLAKLASGSRITQASDDAAGLAISTKISSDVTALAQAATNASHGISVLQTADGGASNISDILQRMKALASQSASGTVTDNERVYIDAEFQQLTKEVDAIAVGTRYNGQSLLDGTSSFAAGINVMVGSDAADTINVALDTLTAAGLKLSTTVGTSDAGAAAVTAVTGVTGVTGVTALTTGSVAMTGTDLTAAQAGGTFTLTNTASSTVTTVTVTGLTVASTKQDVVDAINAGGATAGGYTASLDATDHIVITSNTANDAAASFTAAGTDVALFLGTPVDTAGVTTVTAVTAVTGSAATAASLTGGTAGVTVTADTSFDINGTTVTLSKTGGTNSDGVYTAQDLADAITAAAPAGVTATLVAGALTIATTATGTAATITIDNFTSGTANTILGITSVATGATAGQGTDVAATTQSTATQAKAIAAIAVLDTAITTVSSARADIGSLESRFGFHQASIATSIENLTAAVSSIKDTDVAAEASKLASSKVKTQAAVAAAAQASQMPQELLKLLN